MIKLALYVYSVVVEQISHLLEFFGCNWNVSCVVAYFYDPELEVISITKAKDHARFDDYILVRIIELVGDAIGSGCIANIPFGEVDRCGLCFLIDVFLLHLHFFPHTDQLELVLVHIERVFDWNIIFL